MTPRNKVKPLDLSTIPKSWYKTRWICLGALLGFTNDFECSDDCCGQPHIRKRRECTGLHPNTKCTAETKMSYHACDCYRIGTAVKIAMKIRMHAVEYSD